jgi:hypothetical protein
VNQTETRQLYRVRVAEVRVSQTKGGFPRWSLRLEWQGRLAAWDELEQSPRGAARALMIYKALGVNDWSTLQPDDLIGREAKVAVESEVHFPVMGGKPFCRNGVAFGGWVTDD